MTSATTTPTTTTNTMTADADFWDRLALTYSRKPVDNPAAFDRKIAITRGLMTPDHVVLDVGCGTGSLALRLADAAAEVHGLDASSEMLRIARTKADIAAASNVHFHHGPFDQSFSAFGPASLDGLLAYSILHLMPDPAAGLEHMHRLLKPGGYFVASTVCLRGSWVPYSLILAVMRRLGKAPWVGMLSKAELKALVERAGFTDVSEPDVGAESTVSFLVARKPL